MSILVKFPWLCSCVFRVVLYFNSSTVLIWGSTWNSARRPVTVVIDWRNAACTSLSLPCLSVPQDALDQGQQLRLCREQLQRSAQEQRDLRSRCETLARELDGSTQLTHERVRLARSTKTAPLSYRTLYRNELQDYELSHRIPHQRWCWCFQWIFKMVLPRLKRF